jgi:hypothetical protein
MHHGRVAGFLVEDSVVEQRHEERVQRMALQPMQ